MVMSRVTDAFNSMSRQIVQIKGVG